MKHPTKLLVLGIAAFAVSGCELNQSELDTRCKNWTAEYHDLEAAITACSQATHCVVQMREIKAMQWYGEQASRYCAMAKNGNR